MMADNAAPFGTGHGRIDRSEATGFIMRLALPVLCIAPLALSACAAPGHYPLSGETCSPDDPVLEMKDCDFRIINFLPAQAGHPAASPTVAPPARP